MKLSIQDVEEILYQSLDQDKAKELVTKIAKVEQELIEEAKDSKSPKQKNQFAIIIFDKDGELPRNFETSGLVVSVPQETDLDTVLGKISDATREFNQTKSGTKRPVRNLADAASMVKRRFLKEKQVNIKNRIPCRVLISNNNLV